MTGTRIPRVPGDLDPVRPVRFPGNLSTVSGLGAILLWSTTFALARSLSERIGPLTAGAAVYLVGGSFFLLWSISSAKSVAQLRALPRLYLFGCGSLFVFYTAAIYLAVGLARDRAQLLEIALVNYLWPALTILLSIPLLGNQCGRWLWPGTALAVTGVFLVTTQGAHFSWKSLAEHLAENPAPYALALTAAISWALYSNLTRRWAEPEQGGAVGLFLAAAGLVLLGLRLATSEPTHWSFPAVGEATALATVTVLAYGLWDVAMRRGNLLLVAVCSYFTPLLSTALSCLYLEVSPSPKLWIGCLLLVAGSLMTWRSVRN